jgi:hypothetical protein
MMHKLRLYGLVALPVALGLAACSKTEVETSPNPAVTADANAAARTDTVVVKTDTTAAVAAAAVAVSADTTAKVASGTTQMFTLEQVNGSNFTGQVTLTDLGMGKSRIAVTLNAPANADKDADHKQHIHSGTCAAPGPVVHPLDDIEGNGKPTEDEIPMGLADVTAGNHIVNVHEAGGDRPIACVDLKKAM